VWMLHRRAKSYATSPSAMMGVDDEYLAFCFDEAIEIFGTMVDGLLKQEKTSGSGKHQKTVRKHKTISAAIREAIKLGSATQVGAVTQLLDEKG
jgi:hypothetical protein